VRREVRRRWLVVGVEEMIGIITKFCRCQISNDVHTYIPEDSDFGPGGRGGYIALVRLDRHSSLFSL